MTYLNVRDDADGCTRNFRNKGSRNIQRIDSPSVGSRIATGAAVGVVAGLVAAFAMDRFQALTQPSSDDDSEPATQQAADEASKLATGSPLAQRDKPAGGQFVHYGIGAVLGMGYGIIAEFVPKVTAGGGTVFATESWALLDEIAVPAAGWGDAPWKAPAATQTYSFASHLVFGLAAEGTRRAGRAAIRRMGGIGR